MIRKTVSSRPLLSLLILFAILHIAFVAAIYSVGFYKILPNMFNENGALASAGSDVLYYWDDFPRLKQSLDEGNFSVLFDSTTQIHVRLYIVSYVVLYPLFGNTVLSLEGMNLILYLLIIFLTYKIGEKCFDAKTGVLASIIVGLLPSLLLHTSQPLRDTLFIVLMLAYTSLLYTFFDKGLNLLRAITLAIGGILLLGLLWLIRDNITLIYLAMAGTCLGLLLLKTLQKPVKREFIYNFACLLVLLIGILFIPKLLQNYLPEKREATPEQAQLLEEFTNRQNDYDELKSKNFWRIVTSSNIEVWKKTKDMNLARIFNGMEFTRLSEQ